MKLTALLVPAIAIASIAQAQVTTRTVLVPVFAENVQGLHGSLWHSEIRLFNSSAESRVIIVHPVYPGGAVTCAVNDPFSIPPGALVQMRSVGCGDNTIAAVELQAPRMS